MKQVLLGLVALFSLAACSNHGKKVKVEGTKGEVYYKGEGVTEDDAKKTGDFLKAQGFFTNEKGASVQVMKEAGNYVMRFVYDKEVLASLPDAETAFKMLAIKAAKEIFGGSKVNIALANKSFEDYKTIAYDEALAKSLEAPAPGPDDSQPADTDDAPANDSQPADSTDQ